MMLMSWVSHLKPYIESHVNKFTVTGDQSLSLVMVPEGACEQCPKEVFQFLQRVVKIYLWVGSWRKV